jgi:hypothetical protein
LDIAMLRTLGEPRPVVRGGGLPLGPEQLAFVRAADTFFIASVFAERGSVAANSCKA